MSERTRVATLFAGAIVALTFLMFFVVPTIMLAAEHWYKWLDRKLG